MSQQPTSTNEAPAYGEYGLGDAELVLLARMKRERNRRGWSQARLSEEVNKFLDDDTAALHPTAITKLEWVIRRMEAALPGERHRMSRDMRGRNLRLNEALAIAKAFDMPLEQMLSDDDLSDTHREMKALEEQLSAVLREGDDLKRRLKTVQDETFTLVSRFQELERAEEGRQRTLAAEAARAAGYSQSAIMKAQAKIAAMTPDELDAMAEGPRVVIKDAEDG